MRILYTIFRELIGLFIDDGSLVFAILGWIALCVLGLRHVELAANWQAAVLFLGLAVVLAENVVCSARRGRTRFSAPEIGGKHFHANACPQERQGYAWHSKNRSVTPDPGMARSRSEPVIVLPQEIFDEEGPLRLRNVSFIPFFRNRAVVNTVTGTGPSTS
jgi:hypothetical protein